MTCKKTIILTIITIILSALTSCNKTEENSQKKPNILWLVVEDMSPYLSSYGNKFTYTPTIDSLAQNGILFSNAYSNGAQCSPARSTLISSIYAPMLATDFHREKRAVPQDFYFPKYLSEAGYYCTNNSKKDYNANNEPKDIWDVSSKNANYLNREDKTQPFFSVFNYGGTHTKRVATKNTNKRTHRNISLDSVALPPYLPDESEIRDDLAWHYEAVNEMDNWIKEKLNDLKASGEADNTIVFFYSDHGCCLPRSKAYLYDTGTRVPLIVNFPDNLKHLAGKKTPSRDENLVGFIDLAPTLFNLLGIDIPEFMMGQAFLGDDLPKPKSDIFLYRANQEQNYIPSRALTDGRFKLIWNFNSAYPNGTRQSYQWKMPSYQAWDKSNIVGKVDSIQKVFWKPTDALEFYDTKVDSFEVNNLINEKKHLDRINQMKEKLIAFMKDNNDLGLYPWSMRKKKDSIPFYNIIRKTNQPVSDIIDAAAFSSTANASDINTLKSYLNSSEPAIRYWGSIGILQLLERHRIKEVPDAVFKNFKNKSENTEIRLLSAEILVKHNNNPEALNYVLDEVKNNYFTAYATLQNLGKLVKPIENELIQLREIKKLNQFYIKSALINSGYLPYDDLWED